VYTLTADRNVAAPGGEVRVSWTTSSGGHNDYTVLFRKGDPNTGHGWWTGWTDGAPSGTFTLEAPVEPGQYEFRYLLDDGYSDAVRVDLTVSK
jgi:hypothetical protein